MESKYLLLGLYFNYYFYQIIIKIISYYFPESYLQEKLIDFKEDCGISWYKLSF